EAGVPLVEDVAQAFGARWDGRRLGSLGTLGAFSFYPTKNLGGFGDGGLITTHDAALAERCRQLRNHGSRGDGVHVQLGFNSRLDALQAALLRVKLPQVDAWNAERRRLARRYHELLQGLANLRLPPADDSERHVWQQYTVRVPAAWGPRLRGRGGGGPGGGRAGGGGRGRRGGPGWPGAAEGRVAGVLAAAREGAAGRAAAAG